MAKNFHNVSFPEDIALGAIGGPQRRVEVVELASGFEERNLVSSRSRRRYEVGTGINSVENLRKVIDFFEARQGAFIGFRFKDWSDFYSGHQFGARTNTKEIIGYGDGVNRSFQLRKNYRSGEHEAHRKITRPKERSVKIEIDEIEARSGFDFQLKSFGIIEFAEAPVSGAPIFAHFEFDVPVRFDIDYLPATLSHFQAGEIPNIPLVEILE